MKKFFQVLIVVLVVLVALKLLVVVVEPKLTFFPYRKIFQTPEDFGVEYQEVSIPTSDSETLNAWFLERPSPRAEIVFFHGNGGNLSTGRLDFLISLYQKGYSVFIFDYRGYGNSTGTPSETGLYLDSQAAVSYFWGQLHRERHRVVYLGRSLGGVAAACAASVFEPDGIILEGTFPDKNALLAHYPLYRILSPFSRYKLSTIDFLRDVRCPVLVAHGEFDRVVPLAVGKKLYQLLDMKKEFLMVEGGGHVNLGESDSYWECLQNFVNTLKKPSTVSKR